MQPDYDVLISRKVTMEVYRDYHSTEFIKHPYFELGNEDEQPPLCYF